MDILMPLNNPNLNNHQIVTCLKNYYSIDVSTITPLSGGADFNTNVYSVTTRCSAHYFLKIRRKEFLEASLTIPKYLTGLGHNGLSSNTNAHKEDKNEIGNFFTIKKVVKYWKLFVMQEILHLR
nr:spectinomycin phosphotransferase [uncultured bacterium]